MVDIMLDLPEPTAPAPVPLFVAMASTPHWTAEQFLDQQRQRVLDSYNGTGPGSDYRQLVAFAHSGWASKTVGWDLRDLLRVGRVGRMATRNVFVTMSPGDPMRVWVRGAYSGYRRAFDRALSAVGLSLKHDFPGYDVDHAAARSTLPRDYYVEVLLVPSSVNRSWGSAVERLEAAYARSRGVGKPTRDLSHGRAAKLLGIAPPQTNAGTRPVIGSLAWSTTLGGCLTSAGGHAVRPCDIRDWAEPFVSAC